MIAKRQRWSKSIVYTKSGKNQGRKTRMPGRISNIEDIRFFSNGFELKGSLHLPSTHRPPVVIGSHGLHSSSSSPKQIALADQCNRLGIAYFRFDHRGCGRSAGEFEEVTSLEARCRDLIDAVSVISGRTDIGDRFGLFGSSMGGSVCLSVANELGANTLVTFAAPIRSRFLEKRLTISKNSDRPTIFLDTRKRCFDITSRLPEISSILIFHGESDEVVPVSHAEEIHKLVKPPKKLIKQKQGDHPMSNRAHQKVFIREASLWFRQGLKV
jgi:alpha-beta hydrolase superfamily lysophospholipase